MLAPIASGLFALSSILSSSTIALPKTIRPATTALTPPTLAELLARRPELVERSRAAKERARSELRKHPGLEQDFRRALGRKRELERKVPLLDEQITSVEKDIEVEKIQVAGYKAQIELDPENAAVLDPLIELAEQRIAEWEYELDKLRDRRAPRSEELDELRDVFNTYLDASGRFAANERRIEAAKARTAQPVKKAASGR